MTQMLDNSVMRMFRLTNGPGALGLSCTPGGLFLPACLCFNGPERDLYRGRLLKSPRCSTRRKAMGRSDFIQESGQSHKRSIVATSPWRCLLQSTPGHQS
jgi:hypothetical protein